MDDTECVSTAQQVLRPELRAELEKGLAHARSSLEAGLERGSLGWELLTAMNEALLAKYSHMADVATALASFGQQLKEKQAPVQASIDSLDEYEVQLDKLTTLVDSLDAQSRRMAQNLGIAEPSGFFDWGLGMTSK
eukprot:gene12639-15872_t